MDITVIDKKVKAIPQTPEEKGIIGDGVEGKFRSYEEASLICKLLREAAEKKITILALDGARIFNIQGGYDILHGDGKSFQINETAVVLPGGEYRDMGQFSAEKIVLTGETVEFYYRNTLVKRAGRPVLQ